MAIQKKHGKGRLDKWYKLAKEKGYRARAAFKLIQLNKKYNFLEKSKVLIDLCAAPGSWCQVASEVMPANALIIGVDLAPIKAIPRCITFQSDITTDKCRATIRQHLKTWKADTVLHDGAPNVGTAWVQDAFTQAELVLQSMKLATEFLVEGGTFVTKVFRSKDYNSLLWVFNQLFTKVEATKPPSSRNVSAEIFVVCRGFKAPKHIDPRFLDAKNVFAELADPIPNNEAKVFKPEIKKRKREGYEEGDWTQFKEAPVSEFINTTDPIAMLGSLNKLSFVQPPNGDVAIATIENLPATTIEIKNCCGDLKVLGRADFKRLLRWRLKVRDIFGFSKKKQDEAQAEEVAEVEPMDEEMQIMEDMQRLEDQDSKKKKKARRHENERKQKEVVRMQMNMTTPFEIGMEQAGPQGDDSVFDLKSIDKAGAIAKVAHGKMATVVERQKDEESEEEVVTDDEGDHLDAELDHMYSEYVEQRSARDAKYRAKRARKEDEDGEWNGFSDEDKEESSDEELVQDEDSDWSEDEDEAPRPLITDLDKDASGKGGLTKRASRFFDQDIFKGIPGLEELEEAEEDGEDSGIDVDGESEDDATAAAPEKIAVVKKVKTDAAPVDDDADSSEDEDKIEEVARDETQWEQDNTPMRNGRPDIDIITAEAMTMAHQLATGKTSKATLLDDSFNRYSLRDVDGLPDWFLDDENKHSKLQRPKTAAAAAAIKEKLRALNARPIKKVREAKARKKFKAAQKLEKLKKKSAMLADEEGLTEKEKAQSIARLMSRASKKKPKSKVTVVVARGTNKGQGRPGGTKGRYKMVDARMKKDVRAEKRLAKKKK
ncbi:FtsJ-domain-containing protein [Karstenula rhodostoma CBS 690.94]|uniref:FtsJ-domain-containing protein n=1 Tax=Karstenula rhodostoma CBS 690.94 TaxID=1392251 RepID=A0A9P4PZ99_9PLEO|nr:FtsJ-domain-containing protein [Karstenula rhodostoma CBS 690.94]